MTDSGAHATVIDMGAVVVPDALSVTRTTNEDVPTPVGVPDITPPELNVIPAGREPLAMAHVYGAVPPWAASVT